MFLRFPVVDIIPSDQELYNAHLELYAFDASSTTRHVTLSMATLNNDFSEATTNWLNKPGDLIPLGERTVVGNGQSLDMTQAVKMWEDQTDPNHGIVIKPVSEDFYYHYGSREEWISPPVLKIFCGDPVEPTATPTATPTPTRTLTVTPVCPAKIYVYADADTWVDSRNPETTHGSDPALHVDLTSQGQDSGRSDAYIHFPKDARLNGAYVYSARLRLHRPESGPEPAADEGRVDTLADPFSEQTTNFNNKPSWGSWNTGWVEMPWWITYPEWDVTEAVQEIYHSGAPNNGFHVWVDGGRAVFDSREGLAKPELIIECGLTSAYGDTNHYAYADATYTDHHTITYARSRFYRR